MSSIFWLVRELLRMLLSEDWMKLAAWVMAQAWLDNQSQEIVTLAVVLSPASMSVVMVLAVPLGPSPCLMNSESIMGTERLALRLVAVLTGLGVIICASLYLLYRLTLLVCMVCIELISQESPGKQIWIWVTAAESRLVMLPTLSLRLVNPAHLPSPFMAESKVRQMLQSVMDKFCLRSGTKENDIIVIKSVPLAHNNSSTIITRIYLVEQGLLSMSLRIESQGGQERSKRQQKTVKMQKAKKMIAKMMQGMDILKMQALSASQSPFATISCTLFWSL